MGNHNIKAAQNKFCDKQMSAGDVGTFSNGSTIRKFTKNQGPGRPRKTGKIQSSREKDSIKLSRSDIQRIKNMLNESRPVMLTLMDPNRTNLYPQNIYPLNGSLSEKYYKKTSKTSCRRVKSNPCSDFCPECHEKSVIYSFKNKHF